MSWQILNSDITIGTFRFSGVHEVVIKKTIHSYMQTASITVPGIAYYVPKGGSAVVKATTGTLFTDGAAVSLNLGYNGDLNSEFVGFVKRRGTGMPLVVECEGYVRQLRQNVNINGDFTKNATTAKKLLQLACQGTDIDVICPVDFAIKGVKLVNANGVQICDMVKDVSAGSLTVFFIGPRHLWCGLPYTAYAHGTDPFGNSYQVNYRLGWNCPRKNGLKERIPSEPVQVIMKGKYATGKLLYNASKEKAAKNKVTHLTSQLPDSDTMGKAAQEIAYAKNYTGYEGGLTAFLVPYAEPGMKVNIVNAEYPDLNGVYLIEETEVRFGVRGARRIVTVGPRVSFDTN